MEFEPTPCRTAPATKAVSYTTPRDTITPIETSLFGVSLAREIGPWTKMLELAGANYVRWPYSKLKIRYEKLVEAALLVKTRRSHAQDRGLWLDED